MSRTPKNDHKKLKSLAVLWLIVLAPLMIMVQMLPEASAASYVTVNTATASDNGLGNRQSCYAGGGHFVFYYNGSALVREFSSDGLTWSGSVEKIFQTGAFFDIVCRTDTIYVAVDTGSTKTITYLRGTVGVAGAITWSVNTTFTTDAAEAAQVSAMEVNSTGHPHIYYSRQSGGSGAWNRHLSWARSSDGIGTSWTLGLVDANGGDSLYYVDAAVVIKSNDDEVVFYRMASTPTAYLSTRTWDNSTLTWSAETDLETCITAPTNNCTNQAILSAAIDSNGYTSLIYGCGATCPEVARQNKVVLLYNNGTNYFIPIDTLQNYEEISVNNYNDTWYLYWKGSATTIKSQNGTDPAHFNSIWTPYTINTPLKISGSTQSNYFGLVLTNGSSPYTVSYAVLNGPAALTPTGTLELSGLKCGDIWVTPDKTYLTATLTVQAQTPIQNASVRFNDSLHLIQADYDNTTARWNLSQGRDYVSLNPQATATSTYTAAGGMVTTDNYTLQVEFMFLANEAILDKNDVEVQYEYALQNGSVTTWTNGATMNIYNKGGATEYWIQNNAGFLPGGDVYSVYAKNTSSIGVNQTWVRLQHLHANFAVRLVLNSTNSGEDNLWQDYAHKGANEYYTNSTDWTIYYKIWYYDEQNGAWVQGWILSFVKQQGDIGSADEWTELNVTFYNGPNSEKTASQNMSAWVEREPEARVRLWLDLWFNKINASSVHGARLNPMYFGIHYTGWALWGTGVAGQWEPMYKNESQAAAFDRLQDANGVENVTSPMLTCMKTEQILVMNENTYALEGLSPLHYNYTLQIDNWDVLEPKLSPTRNMEGVNTPLIVEPLLPDKTASSFWAPIYAALASIGGWIFKAFSALAEIVWQAVRAQFPWFADWVDNVNAALANGVEIANEMLSGIVEILKMVGGQVWIFSFITDFIRETWEFIYPMLAPFTQNSTVWLTLLIIIFGILPIADNLSMGRWDLVRDDLEMIWGFMRTVIIGIYVIVTTLVGWIISAIPL